VEVLIGETSSIKENLIELQKVQGKLSKSYQRMRFLRMKTKMLMGQTKKVTRKEDQTLTQVKIILILKTFLLWYRMLLKMMRKSLLRS